MSSPSPPSPPRFADALLGGAGDDEIASLQIIWCDFLADILRFPSLTYAVLTPERVTRGKQPTETVTCEGCAALMCSQVGRAVRLWNLRTTDQLIHDLVEVVEDTIAMLSRSGINTTIENALLARAYKELGKERL